MKFLVLEGLWKESRRGNFKASTLKENFSLFDFGAIVAAASLAHDLGNPPFGHAGEEAISDFFILYLFERTIVETFRDRK
ncbi:MAG: HD domain-containing protein [Cyclobacteriaceae bacterium]